MILPPGGNAAVNLMENTLKELRRRSGLTQIELAQRSGVPRNRIQLAEGGLCNLREDEWQAIRAVVRPQLACAAELLESELKPSSMTTEAPKIPLSRTQGFDNEEHRK